MTYAASEASVQDGAPTYKILFTQGATSYRYTTASYFISDSEGTWTPAPLTISAVQQTREIARNGVTISLPRDNAVAQLFLGKVPETTTSITIYRGHDPSDFSVFQVYWRGRVVSADASGDLVTLECEDIFTSMQRSGLRARYQKGCRHALYSSSCGVVLGDYEDADTISAKSGFTVTVGNTAARADGYYTGGIIALSDGKMRYILSHTGSTLTLLSPFDSLTIGSPLPSCSLYPGCAHNTSDCNTKFSNLLNYGGFPFLPSKNPFQNTVEGSIV